MNNHLAAIKSGRVTKTNVIGLRKAISADWRRSHGYSVGCTAPKLQGEDLEDTLMALNSTEPLVTGELVESGLKLLRSKRYAKQLASVQRVIDNVTHFRLVRFDWAGEHETPTPVYRACTGLDSISFLFRNVPWQNGGKGPELVS